MNVYKIEVMVIDLDELGAAEIRHLLESTRYPNHCMSPVVKAVEVRDVGDWHDDHPLNQPTTSADEYLRLFAKPLP